MQSVTEYYRVLQSVTECYRVLQSVTECYRILQNITEYYRILQSIKEYFKRIYLDKFLGLLNVFFKKKKSMADFCNTYNSFFLLIRLLEMRLQGNYSKGECFFTFISCKHCMNSDSDYHFGNPLV